MKIIDARTGSVMAVVAFKLGEDGRGRHLEEVRIDSRTPPIGEEVGYKKFGGDATKGHLPHIVLTTQDPNQKGILLRINTRGCYTKGSCGAIALKGGDAELLTQGHWAEGAAGAVANGPDALWHVRGPSVFGVILQGGERKGMGHRYLIITKNFRVVMVGRDALCQMIATDENPEVVETVRQFSESLSEEVKDALRVADELEEAAEAPAVTVQHFVNEHTNLIDTLKRWNIAVPVAFDGVIGGVSGVQSGTLIPGSKQLLVMSIGPGGGRRYGYTVLVEEGITRLASEKNHKGTTDDVLAVVESPSWQIAWEERKDGETVARRLVNAGGLHRYNPNPDPTWAEEVVETTPWPGHEAVSPTASEMGKIFGVEARGVATRSQRQHEPLPHQPAPAVIAIEAPPVVAPAVIVPPAKPLSAEDIKAQLAKGGLFRRG